MTKEDIIKQISEKTGIDPMDVQKSVEAFFTVVKSSMAEGENIYVRGFGSFFNKKRAKKIAKNITKNTSVVIDEHYVPSFKPSKVFVEKVKRAGIGMDIDETETLPITLVFNSKEHDSSDIAEKIAYLSQLYQEVGGDRLIIDTIEVTQLEGSPEPVFA